MAVAAVAKVAPVAARSVKDNTGLYLIGGVVAWWLLREGLNWSLDKAWQEIQRTFVQPFQIAAEKAEYVASETTKGVQFWEDDFWTVENLTHLDVPFSERDIPLIGGVAELGRPSYYFEYDVPGSDLQIPLAPGLTKEPDESWADFASTIDIPGLPEYDIRDAPGDVWGKIWPW